MQTLTRTELRKYVPSAAGYLADIEKYNAASMLGYTVLRLGTGQVDHQHVTEIIDWIKSGVRA